MKVVLVTSEHPRCASVNGIGRYVGWLHDGLVSAGVDVLVLVVDGHGCTSIHNKDILTKAWKVPACLRPYTASTWIDHALRTFSPDIVEYSNWGGLGAWDTHRFPRVVRLSTPIRHMPARNALRRLAQHPHAWHEQRTVNRAHTIIADSKAMAKIGAAIYQRSSDTIIPHGFGGSCATEAPHGSDILAVGRWEPRKGFDVLLRAWASLAKELHPRQLHVVGRHPAGDVGLTALRALPISNVNFHGFLSDAALAELRQRIAIQVVPSRFESFGLVALEAWAGGQALIVSDAGALSEVAGDAGLTFPSQDHNALAQKIRALSQHPDLCRRMQKAGRIRLDTAFSQQVWIKQTLSCYAGVLAGRRPHKPMTI
jgi:glycosyltransferase involved in cell wall biosynthesis